MKNGKNIKKKPDFVQIAKLAKFVKDVSKIDDKRGLACTI